MYHPDVYEGKDKERFNKIKEAYDVLRVPEKRREYDIKRKENDVKLNTHSQQDKSTKQGF